MMSGEADQNAVASPNVNYRILPKALPAAAARQRFLLEIALVSRTNAPRIDTDVAAILADTVADPNFLQGLTIESSPAGYTRTAIFCTGSYCVLAIHWPPGQMSPVHSHRAWCALGVHAGTLTETHFAPLGSRLDHGLRLSGCRQLHAGSTSHGPAHDASAHRMANLGLEPAISIHVYGMAFDKSRAELNQIWTG